MTPQFAQLVALVDAYLAAGDFMTLWSPIAGSLAADHELGPFAPSEEPLWDELYDIVYMGQQDSATAGEAMDGLAGGTELQARIMEWRSNATAILSASMTSQELVAHIHSAIASYEYPRVEGTVGTLWTPDRVTGELALLRQSLVQPDRRTLRSVARPEQTVWVVAAIDDVAVFLDETRGEFGLGNLDSDGAITDWDVYGDLVGTFMAR